MNKSDEAMRKVVKAILSRYHQTRLSSTDPVDFIVDSHAVKEAFWKYAYFTEVS